MRVAAGVILIIAAVMNLFAAFGYLASGALVGGAGVDGDEGGVVAEPAAAARPVGDATAHLAVAALDSALRRHECDLSLIHI